MVTEVFKIDRERLDAFSAELRISAQKICEGGLVVFPTETVYGLGGNALDPIAARKIFAAKGRPSDNPLIIHISDPREADKYAVTNDLYYKLAERFMPGPLTVILESRSIVPPETRGGLSTVAVRCPENQIARRLIEYAGVPIAAPSANLSGSPSPTTAQHVIDDMDGKVDVIIDGGECEFGLESTIVKIDGDDKLTLLRPGKITVDDLTELCDVSVAAAVVDKLAEGEVALSPGMKYRHYAPKSPVILLDGDLDAQIEYIKNDKRSNKAVIAYREDVQKFSAIDSVVIYELGAKDDKMSQAHRLFDILRKADKRDFEVIYAPLPDTQGVGLALYNRMIRAAAHTIINLRR